MTKIWLCGITQNSRANINEMTRDIMPFIDGLIFIDSQSNDGTKELLEERKGSGEIISLPWMGNHSWSMQAFLNSDKMQPGDYFIVLDSSERLNVDFASNLRNLVKELEIRNIGAVYHYSKLVIARYNSNVFFHQSPHWGASGLAGHAARLEDSYPNAKDCIFSTRNDNRRKDHFIKHFVKYYLNKISNHLLLGRESQLEEFRSHEEIRNKFRLYCLNDLHINPLSADSLSDFLKFNGLNYELKWFLNFEPILNSFYTYYILGHSVEDIQKRLAEKKNFIIK
jgi:hypothetical protein